MTSYPDFCDQFTFNPDWAGNIGVEREAFLRCVRTGLYMPSAQVVIAELHRSKVGKQMFSPEFSACQVETRSKPCLLDGLAADLEKSEQLLRAACLLYDFEPVFAELAPSDMPFDYYPDEKGRYEGIASTIEQAQYEAACRVAGLHVHIGMPNAAVALEVYNKVLKQVSAMCTLANHSKGERLRLYKTMGEHWQPPYLRSWNHFHDVATEQGFADDPRKCYWLLRISRYGTIEFRMFGSIPSIPEITEIARKCQRLCIAAMPEQLVA